MRHLWWISGLFVLGICATACRQNREARNGQSTEQTAPGRGEVQGEPREAPRPGVPDRDALDSLKQEKQRLKDGDD